MQKTSRPPIFSTNGRIARYLLLTDYPECTQHSFLFEEVKNVYPEKAKGLIALRTLSELHTLSDVRVGEFRFDEFGQFPTENPKFRNELVEKISKGKNSEVKDILRKILRSQFDFSDLERGLFEYKNRFWEVLEYVNFNIEITKDAQEKMIKGFRQYVDMFMQDELKPDEKNYPSFTIQKRQAIQKINTLYEEFGSKNLVLKKNYFENKEDMRLIETVFAMEQEKYLIINSLTPTQDDNLFSLGITLTRKFFHTSKKQVPIKKMRELPIFKIENGLGYVYWTEKKRKKKIGKTNARYCLLLKFLLKAGFGNPKTHKEAYEAIEGGRHYATRSYRDAESGAVGDAVQRLRKIGIDPLQIRLENTHITLE